MGHGYLLSRSHGFFDVFFHYGMIAFYQENDQGSHCLMTGSMMLAAGLMRKILGAAGK